MIVPVEGLEGLIQRYGDPLPYVNDKPRWEALSLRSRSLQFGLPYAYGPQTITRVRAHRLVVDEIVDAFAECLAAGVPSERLVYGGCYVWRPKRSNIRQPSVHTWGAALDLDPVNNPQAAGGAWRDDGIMLHPKIVDVFLARGWVWGNDFPTPDPQHWQVVRGY